VKEFVLYIENGVIANKKHVKEGFENLADGRYQVTIKPRKRRSKNQNAYYHAVVCAMCAEGFRDIGYREVIDAEIAHKVLAGRFLKRRMINEETGEIISEWIQSTTKLSTTEMEEYLDQCRQFAAEYLGISIPLPNQQGNFFQ
jgi:hypothetical protein